MGIGKLFKPNKYFYKGTLINGKKEGYGFIFKKMKNGDYLFYMGEWESNKRHGFGISYFCPNNINQNGNEQNTLLRGKFRKGSFVSGIEIKFKIEEKQITINKFQGLLKDNDYNKGEKLYKTIYKKTDQYKVNWEIDTHYFYQGEFKDRKEHGRGICVKNLPNSNYRYYYRGEFENGLKNGEGTILFEGNIFVRKYEGFFENDRWFCRFGRVYFLSGDVYEGFFDKFNCKHLVGCYRHSKYDHKYDGKYIATKSITEIDFNEDEFDRKEKHHSKMVADDEYFGAFLSDKKHGLGKYLFIDEKLQSVGNYIEGERNGNFDTVKSDIVLNQKKSMNDNNFHNFRSITNKVIKIKKYFLIENDQVIDDSDKPFN